MLSPSGEKGIDLRTLVVPPRTRLPEMAKPHIWPHTWVNILLGYLPRLYIWHAHCRHVGTFTSPSTRYQIHWDRLLGQHHH
jgi:hypothetical protein